MSPLEEALRFWSERDSLGGFVSVGAILWPGWEAKRVCRAPHREDHSPSFSVYRSEAGKWCFKDHATDEGGSLVDFVALSGMDIASASRWLIDQAGVASSLPPAPKASPAPQQTRQQPGLDWSACAVAFSDEDAEKLRAWRGYSESICSWLRENRLIGMYDGYIAFPVHDAAGAAVGAHYRIKDGTWRFSPIGTRVRPLVFGNLTTADQVHVFESQWDALAVRDAFRDWDLAEVAFVITRGASHGALVAGMARPEATLLAWPQNDPEDKRDSRTGRTPAEKWLDDICKHAGVPVRRVCTPAMHKDPNVWLRAGATADDFFDAMNKSKKIADNPPPAIKPKKAKTASNGSTPATALRPSFDAYYDAVRKEYLVRNSGGRWLSHPVASFKMLLRKHGISTKLAEGARVSQAEAIILEIQDTRDVRYAGPLAGRDTGFYDECGVRFLVTDSPRIVAPVPGDWGTIRAFLTGLVGMDPGHGEKQLAVLFGWLKCAYEALAAAKRQPGQALVLAGPVQCGKSLLQAIITALLGGRCAKPYRYLAGRTDFNSELFAAEHLALEDEQSTTDIRSRMQLGSHIKEITVNEMHSCHGKNREAVSLCPFWRLSISLNDDEESLLVLPPIKDDVADKLILLRCMRSPSGFPTGTPELREEYWQRLMAELPAFIDYLTKWPIPEELADERFGVAYFHHPELLRSLESLAPETRLLELIDRELWRVHYESSWEGSAAELEGLFRQTGSTVSFDINRLLTWPNACGTYLARIAEKHPDRVSRHRTGDARLWTIQKAHQNCGEPEN